MIAQFVCQKYFYFKLFSNDKVRLKFDESKSAQMLASRAV